MHVPITAEKLKQLTDTTKKANTKAVPLPVPAATTPETRSARR